MKDHFQTLHPAFFFMCMCIFETMFLDVTVAFVCIDTIADHIECDASLFKQLCYFDQLFIVLSETDIPRIDCFEIVRCFSYKFLDLFAPDPISGQKFCVISRIFILPPYVPSLVLYNHKQYHDTVSTVTKKRKYLTVFPLIKNG